MLRYHSRFFTNLSNRRSLAFLCNVTAVALRQVVRRVRVLRPPERPYLAAASKWGIEPSEGSDRGLHVFQKNT